MTLFRGRFGSNTRRKAEDSESTGTRLRVKMLTATASQLGLAPDDEYPRAYGVLVDWPVGDDRVATVVAMRNGAASLYTNFTFGVIGGEFHASAREAAMRLVRIGEGYVDASELVTKYPYPSADEVYYYILTYSGVRRCVGKMEAIDRGSDPTTEFFRAAQDEITELKLISTPMNGTTPE